MKYNFKNVFLPSLPYVCQTHLYQINDKPTHQTTFMNIFTSFQLYFFAQFIISNAYKLLWRFIPQIWESCCLAFHASHGTYHTLRSSLLHLYLSLHVWDAQTLWVRKVNVGCTLSTGNMKSERQRDQMRNTPKMKKRINWEGQELRGESVSSLDKMQRSIKNVSKWDGCV